MKYIVKTKSLEHIDRNDMVSKLKRFGSLSARIGLLIFLCANVIGCYWADRYLRSSDIPICKQAKSANEEYKKICTDGSGDKKICKDKYDDYMDLSRRCSEALNAEEKSIIDDIENRRKLPDR